MTNGKCYTSHIMAGSKKDFTQTAFDVFQQAIGETEKPTPLTGRKANSSKGGKIGGAKRAESMTKEQRAEQAKKAAEARWASTPPRKSRAKVSLNEAITTDLVRDYLKKLGYDNDKSIVIEREQTADSQIDKLLQTASKKGSGKGYPDFIITSPQTAKDLVCVVECKADVAKHKSDTLTKYADYAVDGAKLYATYLSKEKDVLYIGVSGQNEKELRVNHYLQLKNEKPEEVLNPNKLYPFNDYIEQYKKSRYRVDYENLIDYTRRLNSELHKKKIPENNRAILFSGILIALEDDTFHDTFASYTNAKRLSDFLVESVTQKLEYANIPKTRVHEMQQAYNFIKSHTALIDEGYLITLVSEIHKEVRPFIKSNQYFDIISHCYVEFLKYANSDKKLGIVLTPAHIAELFCELANVTKDSVVLDNCCGTSSFLIAAMQKMISQANGDQAEIEKIKKERLVGIEYQDHIFTLAVSNMIIHGDGKTNIIKGDCFKKIQEVHKYKPTVGLLNPPYSEVTGIDELEFIENNLSAIEKNGIVVAIVPMSCALYRTGNGAILKQRLLDNHTLEAVMSMPNDLFYPVGTVTCIMVFRAQVPHALSNKKTWFGYWKSDGFVKVKNRGRVDAKALWDNTKIRWLEMYRNHETHVGESVLQYVSATDEWCSEAYMETDYLSLSKENFKSSLREYAAFNIRIGNLSNSGVEVKTPNIANDIDTTKWGCFLLRNLFRITPTKGTTTAELAAGEDIAYIAAKKDSNGLEMMCARDESLPFISEGNCIVFIQLGQGSAGYALYQENDFIGMSGKTSCGYNKNLNKYSGLFIVSVLDLERPKYSFGRSWTGERLADTTIKLPIKENGEIDWEFMENYIKSLPYSHLI